MAHSFSTTTLIRGKEPLLRRLVCEVRYRDGQLYLDHCGRLLKAIFGAAPEWVIAPNPMPSGTTLYNMTTGMQLAFSMTSASLSLDKSSTDELIHPDEKNVFVEQVDSMLGQVLDELEVTEYTRIGFRELIYFPFEAKEECNAWLRDLGLAAVSLHLLEAFVAAEEEVSIAIGLTGHDCRYRIKLESVERPAQIPAGETVLTMRASALPKDQKKALLDAMKKQRQRQINSAFAVVLDVDSFLLEPAEFNLRKFVEERSGSNLNQFREALSKTAPQKGKQP